MTYDKKDAIKYLKTIIKKDTQLFVNIHTVSSSGMTRKMSVYTIIKTKRNEKKINDLIRLNFYLEKAEIVELDKNGYCISNGCGMDMAFGLTYRIKCALFGYEKGINNQQYKII